MDPQEIESVEFRTTRIKEGYDPDEVDAFLDHVAAEMRLLVQELAKQIDENVTKSRQLARLRDAPTGILATPVPEAPSAGALRILEAAQRTAEQVEGNARMQCDEAIRAARTEADQIRGAAQAEADAINARLEDLKAKHEDLRLYLRSHLEAGLSELEANKP